MEAIFDRAGRVVSWLKGNVIYSLRNQCVAFINNGNVFTYQGRHLGVLDRGFFRDKQGHCVTFLKGAKGGPIPPIPQMPPIPAIPPIAPIPPIPPMPPIAPIGSLNWSNISWDQFLNG